MSVLQLAELVRELSGAEVGIVMKPLPTDDPKVRRPDISRAREALGWEPRVDLREGLKSTLN
jgi:nucleoside-diphosphate-sugar epimerase